MPAAGAQPPAQPDDGPARRPPLRRFLAVGAAGLAIVIVLFFTPRRTHDDHAPAPSAPIPIGTTAPATAPATSAPRLTEAQKVERLIACVEHLDGATFIRNGQPHTPAEAAAHLRTKWSAATNSGAGSGGTARQFIASAATRSSLTGEPYRVRLKDGRELTSAELLTAELDRLEIRPPHSLSPVLGGEGRGEGPGGE